MAGRRHTPGFMVAVEKTIASKDSDATVCPECRDTGTVSHWSDVAQFEDRRLCINCEAGRKVESKIADIIKRSQLEQRLSGR